MSKKCIAILSKSESIPNFDGDYVGVDKGALLLANAGRKMVLAIGDFDSVGDDDLEKIKEYTDNLIKLNPIKDDSDSEAAVNELIKQGYNEIILWHPFGQRFDHSFVNLKLLLKYPKHVVLQDEYNCAYVLAQGKYEIPKDEYNYFSIFPLKEVTVSLEGMKYSLSNKKMIPEDIYGLSNEIIGDFGIIEILDGSLLVIQSSDKKRISI